MKILQKFKNIGDNFQDFALLAIRLVLAYGFWGPATTKWKDIDSVAQWFGGMGIPLPKLNAYLAAGTEMAGVFLLALGLFTRVISVPLKIIMLVAIFAVHWKNGFASGDNGYEIALYYFIMLLALFAFGAGKYSLDHILKSKK